MFDVNTRLCYTRYSSKEITMTYNHNMRLTSERAVEKVGNRYDLVLIAARRAREINAGYRSLIPGDSAPTTKALAEVELGHIDPIEYLKKNPMINREERRKNYRPNN